MNQGDTLVYPFPTQRPRIEFVPTTTSTSMTSGTSQTEKRKQENLSCDTCGIEVNSPLMMEIHLRGQRHLKKLKAKPNHSPTENVTNPIESNVNISTSVNTNVIEDSSTTSSTHSTNILQWINEIARFNKIVPHYDLINETGPAHSKHFETRLTIGDEVYLGSGKSIKRAQQAAAEQAFVKTKLIKPTHVLRQSNSNVISKKKKMSKLKLKRKISSAKKPIENVDLDPLELQFDQKYREISDDDVTIEKIHHIVENIERSLKSISDKMMKQCQIENNPVIKSTLDNEDPSEAFRMLKGVMRVSSLAMNLYLKTNHQYEIVLVCATRPTRTFLRRIHNELILDFQQFKSTNPTDDSYRVEIDENDAFLTVRCSSLPTHVFRILLTSSIYPADETNPDYLDEQKCLEAVKEIQRSNWFSENLNGNHRIRNVLLLLFHLQNHRTPLIHLNRWSIVLLVYQCRNSSLKTVRDYFYSIFSLISTGCFLPNGFANEILRDPLQTESLHIIEDLTDDQRLEITRYAQTNLRYLAFNKFQLIFPFETFSTN